MPIIPQEAGFAVAEGLRAVRSAIAAAARRAGRDPGAIDLIAVSKTQPSERIEEAIAAGQRAFGENRVQEAAAKFPALKAGHTDLRLHLIGPLQTNKAREAVRLFDAIETLDRPRLAEALAIAMEKEGRRPECFIQVNTGEEPQKAGVAPKEADGLIAEARERWALPVVGLMCIPPMEDEPALHFALLAKIARRNGLDRLSMGMSADFETAIRLGATELRIGTAIFGERQGAGEAG
jgi:pyridoxal phosphate enzyme (YggS family)